MILTKKVLIENQPCHFTYSTDGKYIQQDENETKYFYALDDINCFHEYHELNEHIIDQEYSQELRFINEMLSSTIEE